MKTKQVFNPYLPSYEYVPDAEPHIVDGRVYIYGSHDLFNGLNFCHRDHLCAAHEIIQIVFSVRPLYHIRSRQPIRQADPGRRRILLPLINTALISPIT